MTHDIRQWLAEITSLQQKLVAVQQERDEAYASAARWRSLYETEAQQRRTETRLFQQRNDALKAEIQQLQQPHGAGNDSHLSTIQQEVTQLQTVAELQEKLTKALMECDRLAQTLRVEQANHVQTRKSLTTALGDTVDMLTKERAVHSREAGLESGQTETVAVNGSSSTHTPEIRSPLLELPRLD